MLDLNGVDIIIYRVALLRFTLRTNIENLMIKTYSLSLLETAINHALQLDPSSALKIQALHGKTIEIIISPLNIHFFISFNQQKMLLLAHHTGVVDTVIYSSPLGLIRLSLLPASKVRSLFNDQIKITGDVFLGQAVKELFDDLNIDWEGHLAQFTGDVVAYQVGSFIKKGIATQKKIQTSIQQHVTEYLQEETRTLPTSEEINDFFNDVDDLTLRVERLEAHINQYISHHETH
jgi:ubiquinone biosynthesis protein UbiJ